MLANSSAEISAKIKPQIEAVSSIRSRLARHRAPRTTSPPAKSGLPLTHQERRLSCAGAVACAALSCEKWRLGALGTTVFPLETERERHPAPPDALASSLPFLGR